MQRRPLTSAELQADHDLESVTVVIVNYNAGDLLGDCLTAALAQARQVVLVDNASAAAPLEAVLGRFADEPRLTVVRSAVNRGFAAGSNLGAARATEPILLFLNPDCILADGSLRELVKALVSDRRTGMVGGLLTDEAGREQGGSRRAVPTPWRSFVRAFGLSRFANRWPRLFTDYDLHRQPLPKTPIDVEAVSGACTMVSRVALDDVGPWDEGYFLHCEDLDLSMRFRARGWRILFVPAARAVHHRGRCGRTRPLFVEWHKHAGMIRFYGKHFRHQYPLGLMGLVTLGVWLRFAAIVAGTASRALGGLASLPAAMLAILLVGLGVVVDPSAYDVSQMPRLLVLSAFLAAAVPLVLGLPAITRRLDTSVLREPVVVAAGVSLGITVASLVVATNITAGFTDVFRTLAAFVVLVVACLTLPLDRHWRRTVSQAFVLAAAVHAAVGIHETLTILGPGLHGRRAMELITGRMSNVNLYAGLLAMLLPWCFGGLALGSRVWRWFSAATAVATVTLLVMLQSRSAWLATAAAAGVVGLVAIAAADRLALPRGGRRGIAAAFLAGLATLIATAAIATTDTPLGTLVATTFVRRPHQAAGPSDGGRTMIWGITSRMIADHPFTGVGAGNFTVRLHEYYGGDDLDFTNLASDNWIQPHDDFLWVAAEKGLPGLVAYLAIFGAAFLAVRCVLRSGTPSEARLAVVCLAALVAYLTFSLFDFPLDRVTHQVHLAILLAVIVLQKHALAPASPRPLPLPAWLVAPPVVTALLLGVSYAAAALGQERQVIAARQAARAGDWPVMLAAAERASTPWKTLDPLATPVAFLEGMARLRLGDRAAATACLERALAANPNRMYVVNNLAALYAEAGRFEEAIPLFALAADRYPDRIEPRHNLAACLVDADRFDEAIAVIEDVPEEFRPEAMRQMLEHAREQARAGRTAPEAAARP